MARNWAICIGVNQYDFLQPLNYAQRDAQLMQEFLCNEAAFDRVLLFQDSSPDKLLRPTRTNLLRSIRELVEKAKMGAGDNFWFFFSGHGMRHEGRDYLMPLDGDQGDIENTAIPISFVTDRLRCCGADNVVLMLDACRNTGSGSKGGQGIGQQTAEVAKQTGVISIFSCSPNEYSFEIEALQHGAFTYVLLEGLGVQGKCATVERLNHYLTRRVPEINRQHGKNYPQTPYTIAEPVTKSHLIILPKYATLADIATMKNDAYRALVENNLDLAEQLWNRVLAAASGQDIEAVKELQRVERMRIESSKATFPHQQTQQALQSLITQSIKGKKSNDVTPTTNLARANQFSKKLVAGVVSVAVIIAVGLIGTQQIDRFVSKPSTSVSSTTDYTRLRNLLVVRKWKEADEETAAIMLKVAGREKEAWIRAEDIEKLSSKYLCTIDQLWIKYSNGKFGFSVQKRIWESVGGQPGRYNYAAYNKFGDRVGWYLKDRDYWKSYLDLTFSLNAPDGHLPGVGSREGWWKWGQGCHPTECLFSRVVACKL